MVTAAAPREHLVSFLARHGADLAALTEQIGTAFGQPLFVVATGSVIEGFGNQESDVDLMVVVDSAAVTDFPVSSHTLGVPVDLNFLQAGWACDTSRHMASGAALAAAQRDRDGWKAGYRALSRLGRIALGDVLHAESFWQQWHADVIGSFPQYATQWWRTEALRQRSAARILAPMRPCAAAQRYRDAILALLEALCAERGQLYVGPKWLPAKLDRLADPRLTGAFWQAPGVPWGADAEREYMTLAEHLLADLCPGAALPDQAWIRLTPGTGWKVERAGAHRLVHRHALRGVAFTADDELEQLTCGDVVWEGWESQLPDGARLLAEQGLAWLSAGRGPQ